MQTPHPLSLLRLALHGLLVVALLAIAPLYETAHGVARTADTMSLMSAHDMSAEPMSNQMPPARGNHDAGCRILCFGWVEAMGPERPEGLASEIALIAFPALIAWRDGIAPAPIGHPPKPLSFV